MTRFSRWSFNDQFTVLSDEENFRRFVCERLDEYEAEAGARYLVLGTLLLILIVMSGFILWRVWR
jgi:hypothetical protein